MFTAVAGAQSVPNPPPSSPAQQASPAAGTGTQDNSSIVLAPKQKDTIPQPPVDSDGETRTVSPAVAAALASGMPRYNPPKPTPTPSGEPADLRDIDKPKNEIKRLPKYVVHETLPPVFRDRDLFTANGLVNLSLQSHPGLMFGNLLGLNSPVAAQMYQDDERLRNMSDLSDTARAMAAGGDLTEGKYILQQSQETYMRAPDDFGPTGAAGGNTGGWGK
jgi:hypothetical protein